MSHWKRISLLLIFTLIFSVIAMFHESRIGKWIDNEVYSFIYSSESFISTSIFFGATQIGEVWAMITLSLIVVTLLMLYKYKIEALFFALTMIMSGVTNPILKNIFDRERPTLLRLIDISGFSFPSGHAMGATAFFGSLMFVAHRILKGKSKAFVISASALFIILISSSRVYLGVHYPTDIIAGIVGGVICILLSQLILRKQLNL
ncbi:MULTISPECIES: phosphatase PAP2 family protein [Staphylococcus]|uniref:Phosphatase PAP2 family protein n=1 Tax=Staphylococcus coagulans TaxID=74706 RepID=A0A9X1E4R0_9STAP|nr:MULTISPECIES: phosphatase PAP2 family protein [Staphylococcus]NHA35913.1 phosphatase PAP2 family protein [Staphylococcus schleiferi]MBA8771007.1 phosphatase PAP2 family protein [Staphylococcus coagulans]MBA8775553.1 phosphatase PAP2 family protein [Staphylococcus coagulans]MBT2829327.1 phosphatase PAP2 family protein [Staphylococcus coagulans]MBT2858801.1 phosphatase PAP2 family protein [Staphylococcus coagulans]